MRPFGPLLPLEEAVRRTLAAARPVRGSELVPLDEALGRVASGTVRSLRNVPSFPRATWDGYALRAADSNGASAAHPVTLTVIGEIFAEERLARPLRPGEAAAIATGGAVPPGADAVEIFEEVHETPGAIGLRRRVERGARIAPAGSDYPRGAPLVEGGSVLGPASLGALAAAGATRVRVRRRPRIVLVPNGNELSVPGARLSRGQIYESNNRTLAAVVRASGGIPDPWPPVRDDPGAIERALRRALRSADAVLVTGGSSVGERDYLPAIFPKLGRLLYHGLAVRPGKPTLAAVARGKLLIGMPGHPTSCLSNAYWLLLPTLRRLAGLPGPGWIDEEVVLDESAGRRSDGLATVVPLRVAGGRATPTFRDSSAISSLARANAFAVLPPGRGPIPRGERLAVHRLPPPLGDL